MLAIVNLFLIMLSLKGFSAKVAFIPYSTKKPFIGRLKSNLASTVTTTAGPEVDTSTSDTAINEPLADFPMRRLKLPMMSAGRDYVIVQVQIHEQGPFNFMIDTGLTTALITPHLQNLEGIDAAENQTADFIEGLAAGGKTIKERMQKISGVELCSSDYKKDAKEQKHHLKLPTLHAIITNFAQEHMDPSHPIDGMLGMEMIQHYDVDFDFDAGRLRFWAPGTAAAVAKQAGLVEIPSAVINESLLLGFRVTSGKKKKQKTDSSTESDASITQQTQPFLGIIDSGSSFSAVNWAAAKLLGLPSQSNKLAYLVSPAISAVGVDNKPLLLPMKSVQFSFVSDAIQDKNGTITDFISPPEELWQPWDPVKVGIGDLPVFELLLGNQIKKFDLPAAVIGMDVLSQRRVILESCSDASKCESRGRRIFVSPHKIRH